MDGLLLIHKPAGITSFDCIRALRRQTGVKKIGHAGTLDPAAEGLMIMLLGSATKQAATFSKLDKVYQAEITLGFNSTTGDREGELVPISDHRPTLAEVESALHQFTGQVEQTPSIYSAIKIGGQEAYKLARKGQAPEMPKRLVTIHSTGLNAYSYPTVRITTKVSSGTYIRSLALDIGQALGTGAYLSHLVRTQIGEFKLSQAANLDAVTTDNLERLLIRLDK